MQTLAVFLLFGVFLIDSTHPFRIIGNLETPQSGLLKNFEQGVGREFEVVKHAVKGEEGDKGYELQQVEEKGAKGLHDKEAHQKHYAEAAGNKKSHNHDDGYYAEQHKGENGERGFHFEDEGSYAKGHSTKGHHNVHKLNEYKKNTEFFDEDHDEAHKEKHGGFEASKAQNSGEHVKSGHANKGYLEGKFGEEGKFEKGKHYLDDKGFNKAKGRDAFYENGAKFAKKGGAEAFENFGFNKKGEY